MLFRWFFPALVLAATTTVAQAGSLDSDPFTLDAGFNAGALRLDRFGGNNGTQRDSDGQRVLRLGDGSFVVAALVDAFGAETGTVTGVKNVGLVHFGADGGKIAWSNVSGGYTDASHDYVVVPNRLDAAYTAIRDVQVFNNRIYVLANHLAADGNPEVRVLAFDPDGSWKGVVATVTDQRETGVGMVFAQADRSTSYLLLVTEHASTTSDRSFVRLFRYVVDAGTGALSLDTAFGTSGYFLRGVVDCRDTANGQDIACITHPVAVAIIRKSDSGETLATPYVFIAGNYLQDPGDGSSAIRRSFVMKTDMAARWQIEYGAPNSAGVHDGVATYDLPASTTTDLARDVAVRYEPGEGLVAFVLHEVRVACGNGFNIARLDASGLNVAAATGSAFGGSDASPCTEQAKVVTYPMALALQDDRLVVVGTQSDYFWGMIPEQNAWLGVVDADRGYLAEFRLLQAKVGEDVALGGFNGVVAADGGRYVAVGTATDSGRNQRDLLLVAGMRADRIFGSSFGNDRYDD